MIALCWYKCYIVQLKEENKEIESAGTQHGMKGHVIVYPQQPSHITSCFLPSIKKITSPICVLFVRSQKPSDVRLQEHAKPLAVNGGCVHRALMWLKNNNPLYYNIELNEGVLHQLEEDLILLFSIQHVLLTETGESLTSRYDMPHFSTWMPMEENLEPLFKKVMIADVDPSTSSNTLRAAAVRHIKKRGGSYIKITHDPEPVKEFYNPELFLMMYPTLFLYSVGGMEDQLQQGHCH
ncbi:hypothetical protein ARMGADRAFT_1099684 [Armillaria gallica]|uniref:DUF6570 domain-containing protein n=1 Tax=Armillaria gallica TaxID=47427 RepID=A0A2H3CLB8_ARMGA|nr:hypothetical protein ARMGADRAFT_1099684 [Armillaria gallica]